MSFPEMDIRTYCSADHCRINTRFIMGQDLFTIKCDCSPISKKKLNCQKFRQMLIL